MNGIFSAMRFLIRFDLISFAFGYDVNYARENIRFFFFEGRIRVLFFKILIYVI